MFPLIQFYQTLTEYITDKRLSPQLFQSIGCYALEKLPYILHIRAT